jgi:hypothetical protein
MKSGDDTGWPDQMQEAFLTGFSCCGGKAGGGAGAPGLMAASGSGTACARSTWGGLYRAQGLGLGARARTGGPGGGGGGRRGGAPGAWGQQPAAPGVL